MVSLTTEAEKLPDTAPVELPAQQDAPEPALEEPLFEPDPEQAPQTAPIFDVEQFKTGALQSVARGASFLKGIEEKTEAIFLKSEEKKREVVLPAEEHTDRSKWLIPILVPMLLLGLTTFILLSQPQANE